MTRQNELIFQQGSSAAEIALLCRGKMQLAGRTSLGQRLLLRFVRSGELLGTASLAGRPRYAVCALAFEEAQVRFIHHENLDRLCASYPPVAKVLIGQLAAAQYRVCRQVGRLAGANARERVVQLLLSLCEAYGYEAEEGSWQVDLRLTESVLGEMIGLSRATISRELSRLRREELIERTGQTIMIQDKHELKRIISSL